MNFKTPEFIRIAQESGRSLDVPGTLLRLDSSLANGYTHGIVVGIEDDGKLVILPGNSRSEVLGAEGERVGLYIDPGQLEQIGAVYDGRVGQMPRVVSRDAQAEPPKTLPYDPNQPGHYLYVERPIDQAPPGAVPVDEGSIPTVLYERTLPQGGGEINKLRQTLTDAAKMSRTLAIHIADAEAMRKQVAEFSTLVNAAQDVMRRSEERSRFDYRDPAGKLLHEPTKRSKDMYVALSMVDKIRSGMETSGLLLLQYRNVIYQLKLHSDIVQRFVVSKQGDEMMKFRDWIMTYNEFANAWARDAISRNKVFVDAAGALRRAWDRYRAKHSIFLRRELTRFGKQAQRIKTVDEWKPGDFVWAKQNGRPFQIVDVYKSNPGYPLSWVVRANPMDIDGPPDRSPYEFDFGQVTTVPPKFKVDDRVSYEGQPAIIKHPFWEWTKQEWRYEILLDKVEYPNTRYLTVREVNLRSYNENDPLNAGDDEPVIARKRNAEFEKDKPVSEWQVGDHVWHKDSGLHGTIKDIKTEQRRSPVGVPFDWSLVTVSLDNVETFSEHSSAFTTQKPRFQDGQQVRIDLPRAMDGLLDAKVNHAVYDAAYGVWKYHVTLKNPPETYVAYQMITEPNIYPALSDPTEIAEGEEPVIARKAQLLEEPVQGEKLYTTRQLSTYGMRIGEEITVHSYALDRSVAPRWEIVAIRTSNGHTYHISSEDLTRTKPRYRIGDQIGVSESKTPWLVTDMKFFPYLENLNSFEANVWRYLISKSTTSMWKSEKEIESLKLDDPISAGDDEPVIARKASILDEPRATLNPKVFDLSTDQQAPKMRPEVRAAVLEQLGKLNLPEDAIKAVYFFGSAAAYQYEDTSDFDVTVVVDPDKTSMSGLMHEISDDLFIAEHPVTYYLRTDDYPIEGSDALYDMRGDVWVRVPQASEGAIHQEEYADTIEDAVEWAKKLDLMIGETRRDAIDYEKLETAYHHVSKEKRAEVYERIKSKLSEISEDVAAFANESDKLHETRAKAFAEELDRVGEDAAKKYLSRNWLPENVLYKILERYQYTKLLKRFDKINDRRLGDGDGWIGEVKQLMPKHAQNVVIDPKPEDMIGQEVWLGFDTHVHGVKAGDHGIVVGVKQGSPDDLYAMLYVKLDSGDTISASEHKLVQFPPEYKVGTKVVSSMGHIKNPAVIIGMSADGPYHSWNYIIRDSDGRSYWQWNTNIKPYMEDPLSSDDEPVIARRVKAVESGKSVLIKQHQCSALAGKIGVCAGERDGLLRVVVAGLPTLLLRKDQCRYVQAQAKHSDDFPFGTIVYASQLLGQSTIPPGSRGVVVQIDRPHTNSGVKFDHLPDKVFLVPPVTDKQPRFKIGDTVSYEDDRVPKQNFKITDMRSKPRARDLHAGEFWTYELTDLEGTFAGWAEDREDNGQTQNFEKVFDNPLFGPIESEDDIVIASKAVQASWQVGTDVWYSSTMKSNVIEPGEHGVITGIKLEGTDHLRSYDVLFDGGITAPLRPAHLSSQKPKFKVGDTVRVSGYGDDDGGPAKIVDMWYMPESGLGNHIGWFYTLWWADIGEGYTHREDELSLSSNDPLHGTEEIVLAQKQTQEFNVVDWLAETKEAVDDFVQNIEELKSLYASDLMWLEQLEEHQVSAEAQGAGIQSDPAVVAASLKTGQEVYHVISYNEDGTLKDAEPLIVKASMLVSCDDHEVTVVGEHGKLKKFSRGRLITAQSEIRPRRRRDKNIIEKPGETNLEELLGAPRPQPKLKPSRPSKPKLKPSVPAPRQRPDVPPGMVPVDADPEEVGAEPATPQSYPVSGEQVPVIQPPQLVQKPVPPKPSQPAPSVPTPDDLEEVRFDDIPENEWRKMNLSERIRLAAVYNQLIAMEYEKVTPPEEGVRKTYIIEPYSYRVKRPRRTNGTPVWYLFAFDTQDNHIKAFIVRNIRGIEILDQTFSPRWDVEFFPSDSWDKFRKNRRPQQPQPEEKVTFVTTPFES